MIYKSRYAEIVQKYFPGKTVYEYDENSDIICEIAYNTFLRISITEFDSLSQKTFAIKSTIENIDSDGCYSDEPLGSTKFTDYDENFTNELHKIAEQSKEQVKQYLKKVRKYEKQVLFERSIDDNTKIT